MPLFTSVQSGDFNASGTWDVGSGFPGAADTFSIVAGHVITAPSGLSVTTAGSVTGSSTSNRGELVIADGGKITLNADLVMNNFNHLQVDGGGELDLNGNDILSVSSSSVYNKITLVGTANNRAKISSSVVGVGSIRRDTAIESFSIDFTSDYCDFVDCGRVMVGSNWYGGRGLRVERTVFVGCDEIWLGGWHHTDGDFIVHSVDIRDNRSTTARAAVIRRSDGSGGTGLGTQLLDKITVKGGTATKIRWECYDIDRSNIVLDRITNESVLGRGYTVSDSMHRLQYLNGIDNGGVDEIRDCYVMSDQQNPHTGAAVGDLFTNGVIEATYTFEPWADDGDHWVVGTRDATISKALILEAYSGVLANALGSARSATYNVLNCTLFGNYNAVYGSIARTENGGTWTGTFNLQSNLTYSKLANARGFNLEGASPPDDQVTLMDYNAWFNVSDRYFGVTSATKTAGVTVGYGGNDLVNVDPQFVDDTRNLAAWAGTVTGTATADAAMLHLLKINGYNETSKTQVPADIVAETPRSATDWVRAGFAPTAVEYQGTSHDGGDIGAIAVQAGSGNRVGFVGDSVEALSSVSGASSRSGFVSVSIASNSAVSGSAAEHRNGSVSTSVRSSSSVNGSPLRAGVAVDGAVSKSIVQGEPHRSGVVSVQMESVSSSAGQAVMPGAGVVSTSVKSVSSVSGTAQREGVAVDEVVGKSAVHGSAQRSGLVLVSNRVHSSSFGVATEGGSGSVSVKVKSVSSVIGQADRSGSAVSLSFSNVVAIGSAQRVGVVSSVSSVGSSVVGFQEGPADLTEVVRISGNVLRKIVIVGKVKN